MRSTVVLVHGVPATAELWTPLRERLEANRKVVALDLPGFATPPPDGWRGTKEDYAGWLAGEVEKVVATDGPVHLVGHDWGCLLTCRVASLHPELLRSFAFGNGPIDEKWPHHALWATWNVLGEGERWMDELDIEGIDSMLTGMGMPAEMAARNAWHHDWNRRITLTLYRSAINVGREWGPDLADIVVPSMAIWGDLDLIVPIEFGRRMATRMGAEVVALPAHHFWPCERPAEAAAALQRLWDRTENSPETILTQGASR